MSVNEDRRPNLGQALAEAFVNQRRENRYLSQEEHEVMLGHRSMVRPPVRRRAEDADAIVDRLVYANAAHCLEEAHDASECPVCTGEVTL